MILKNHHPKAKLRKSNLTKVSMSRVYWKKLPVTNIGIESLEIHLQLQNTVVLRNL
ncbi:hypothetical protein Anas_10450 [Armadillidium nasatum]|uniref:Uncharacterized protein n=1 Tax=Armadillidium nasatum TaxID=96803 RepID=A0A5N5T5M7_9CRUS|nr:hypothetical protein Anas_10450 [Armadillidium nasatum]